MVVSSPLWVSSTPIASSFFNSASQSRFPSKKFPNPLMLFCNTHNCSLFPTLSLCPNTKTLNNFSPKASSSSSGGCAEYMEEPTTNVKFLKSLCLPGCSGSLSLLGTGFREKVFAIIGVKVYAAALYVNESILDKLNTWKGRSASEINEDSSLFSSIFEATSEKSLQIVLVRDIDGKTFWDALDDAISPRLKAPTSVDELALSIFRSIFQGRPLKKGTFIFLTWPDASKMLVCISSDGLPTGLDATIQSPNVTSALFDVFFGDAPVSPSLKVSVANGLETFLK